MIASLEKKMRAIIHSQLAKGALKASRLAGSQGGPSNGRLLLPFGALLFSLTQEEKKKKVGGGEKKEINGNSSTMTQFCQISHFLSLTSSQRNQTILQRLTKKKWRLFILYIIYMQNKVFSWNNTNRCSSILKKCSSNLARKSSTLAGGEPVVRQTCLT